MPWILTVSPRSLAAGGVEVTERATGERATRSIEEVEALLTGARDLVDRGAQLSSRSSGTSFASAARTSASCSWLRLVPSSEMTASPVAGISSASCSDDSSAPVRISSGTSSRLIANVMPGGIEAVMLTSAIRYGDRFSRSDAVGHLLERGRLDDQVGQDARVDPLDDGRHAAARRAQRAPRRLAEPLLRRRVRGGVRDHARQPAAPVRRRPRQPPWRA